MRNFPVFPNSLQSKQLQPDYVSHVANMKINTYINKYLYSVGGRIFAQQRTKATRQGFTIVELVIASAILLLSFGALLFTFLQLKHSSFITQHSLSALHIAREETETLRAGSYSNIVSYTPVALSNTVLSALNGTKECTVVTNNDYKVITLTITWMNPLRSDSSDISLNTMICNTN